MRTTRKGNQLRARLPDSVSARQAGYRSLEYAYQIRLNQTHDCIIERRIFQQPADTRKRRRRDEMKSINVGERKERKGKRNGGIFSEIEKPPRRIVAFRSRFSRTTLTTTLSVHDGAEKARLIPGFACSIHSRITRKIRVIIER